MDPGTAAVGVVASGGSIGVAKGDDGYTGPAREWSVGENFVWGEGAWV